jgi:hypothetical protein
MRCLGPARARTAAYMNISITSRRPSGKVRLFGAVGLVLEAKHLPNLIEVLHGVILWREYRDMRAMARDAR